MKIQITPTTVKEIANEVAAHADNVVLRKVHELEDVELIAHLRSANLSNSERVATYLTHTKLNSRNSSKGRCIQVENGFLAKAFGLHVLAMKRIREELVGSGSVFVTRESNRLQIVYWPTPHAPAAEAK